VAPSRSPPPHAPLAERGTPERGRELDELHARQLRGAAGLVLSLRFLSTAWGRLRAGTQPTKRLTVSHPPSGVVAVTFVGHATVMVTTATSRILTDPLLENFFFGLRRAKAPGIADADLADVRLVLISHAHRDHLHPASLRRLPRTATIVVPPRCADLVARLGFAEVVELAPGRSHAARDVEVTAVPVRHSGTRGLGDFVHRGASGYVIRVGPGSAGAGAGVEDPAAVDRQTRIYFAGDTGYFSGFAEIGRRFRPDVALLPIAGYEPAAFRDQHMSPLDALYAFEDLGARVLIPISHGSFPLSYEDLAAPLDWLRALAQQRGLGASSAPGGDQNGPLDGGGKRLAALDHGETCFFRKRP
jgi:L-ascorbate metabolism protein UlaG (beta-lactamase superfamily)